VNGNPAPLYYAGPTQINFQMPFGAPVGGVQVVTNSSTRVLAAQSFNLNLTAVDNGLFIIPGNRAVALNQDLALTHPPIPSGLALHPAVYGRHGPLSPPLAEGVAAPTTPLSQVSISGQPAQVSYCGRAPAYAGLAQINTIVPADLPACDQPVFITE
jgi:uncharacterized protein (TIGR03437 family)